MELSEKVTIKFELVYVPQIVPVKKRNKTWAL